MFYIWTILCQSCTETFIHLTEATLALDVWSQPR